MVPCGRGRARSAAPACRLCLVGNHGVSQASALSDLPFGLADYYDVLARNAFGNFRELMQQVTLHPAMGVYLSMLGNQKPDADRNIRPDENYARELMQLFTIGLVRLGPDGTVQTDGLGQPI